MRRWHYVQAELSLVSGSDTVALTPKAAAVLDCLLARKGQVVERQELLETVWAGLHVTQDLAREYVFDLRRALGDDAKNPVYIETIRARGFRLIGDVVPAGREAMPPLASERPAREIRATVAVLRPETIGGTAELSTLADAMARDIITELVVHHDIAVIARQSSFAADPARDVRKVAEDLQADYLLESHLLARGDMVRASFRLVDGRTGRHVWAERLDRPSRNFDELADDITRVVVNVLCGWKGELHRAEYKEAGLKDPDRLNAFEHFIRGCDLEMDLTEPGIRRSLHHLDRSLALDPRFARCWVVKSLMLQWAHDVFPVADEGLLKESGEALEQAFQLDPRDATTLSLVALKRAREDDMVGALHAIDGAVAGSQSNADACMTTATACIVLVDDVEQAERLLARAFRLNPAPPGWYRFVEARIRFFLGDYERSIEASFAGTPHVSALAYRCLSQAMLGRADAVKTLQDLISAFPRFAFADYAAYFPIHGDRARSSYFGALERLRSFARDRGVPCPARCLAEQ
jgi:TolB-like protein